MKILVRANRVGLLSGTVCARQEAVDQDTSRTRRARDQDGSGLVRQATCGDLGTSTGQLPLNVLIQGGVLDAPQVAGSDLDRGEVPGVDERAYGLRRELEALGDVGDCQKVPCHEPIFP